VTADQIAKPRLLRGSHSRFVTYRQFVTALGTAPGKYGAAVGRFHSFTKAVRFGSLAIIRLKSTFWHYNPSLLTCWSGTCRLETPSEILAQTTIRDKVGRTPAGH
jgi:hypothetical protein